MAASRCLSLVPVPTIQKCFFRSISLTRAQSFHNKTLAGRLKYQTSAYCLPKLFPRYTSSESQSSAKGLADEILKQRMQNEGGSKVPPAEEESEEEKKKREASWRAMKYSFIAFGATFSALGVWVLVECGSPARDPDGNIIQDEFSKMPIAQQYLARCWHELKHYNKMIREPSRDKLLPDPVTEPYYQPPYTLVLEMKDILVHPEWTYQTGWRFKKRPGVDFFLSQVGPPVFEVVIYTAEQGFTAYPILDALDPNGYITYRLFRDATRYEDGQHTKDLDCLNRDLSKVIAVDCNPNSVKKNCRNAIVLPRWSGNDDDHTLIELAAFLRTIAISEVEDVREVLDFYNQFDDPIEAFKENLQKIHEQEALQQQQKKEESKLPTGSWTPSFLRRR